jgi:hypothetical protein
MIYYIGTVLFGMSDETFWRTTPRRFTALCKAHIEAHDSGEDKGKKGKSQPKRAYIDQIIF